MLGGRRIGVRTTVDDDRRADHDGSAVVTTTTTYPFSYAPVVTHPEAFRGFGELAYVSGGQLYVLDGTGAAPRAVGNGVEVAKAAWSPDGRWLAYQPSTPNGDGALFVLRAAGGTADPDR